jgi:secondary thiamine-phosphate synthase enzyme
MQKLSFSTTENKQILNITKDIEQNIDSEYTGLYSIFVTHTTCALTTADLDPGTDQDMLDAFNEIIPDLEFRHPHDPSHVPDHIMTSIIGTSLVIPVENGKFQLGTWQEIILVEFNGPRERTVIINSV